MAKYHLFREWRITRPAARKCNLPEERGEPCNIVLTAFRQRDPGCEESNQWGAERTGF